MKKFRHILHVTDPAADEATRSRAVELAIDNQAALTFMSVVERLPRTWSMFSGIDDPDELQQTVAAERRRQLLELASEYSCTGVPLDAVVAVGDPANAIVRQVVEGNCDLLVKSADGFGITDRLLGSVSQSLMRLAPCPVWLLKPESPDQFDNVVAAIDVTSPEAADNALNEDILEYADTIARREAATLHVVSVWDVWMETALRARLGDKIVDGVVAELESDVRTKLDQLVHQSVRSPTVQKHLHRGAADTKIRETIDQVDADLLVIGTQCRTGVAGFFIGNTAESILSDVQCSVLTIKPEAFVTPVQ
ncbi:universal stress protein [Roseimaritima sediminicola]|uniref:universal stress protein n=1 Tax=Roseimaritima sediminicola TaxID=2662066 RepID=UPI0012983782|nr:universal stress protein [Roseimaritima sediminicola]